MTKTPSDQTLEGLSALVDGETAAFETRRLLDMAGDAELAGKWKRYHVAGALMRKEFNQAASGGVAMVDLSAKISAAIDAEPAFSPLTHAVTGSAPVAAVDQHAKGKGAAALAWRDWLAKSAIAASIAAAVVFGVQFTSNTGLDNSPDAVAIANQDPVVAAPVGFDLPSPEARNVSLGNLAEPQRKLQSAPQTDEAAYLNSAAVEAELQQLFLQHAELSAQNGKFGLMPMARAAKMQTAE